MCELIFYYLCDMKHSLIKNLTLTIIKNLTLTTKFCAIVLAMCAALSMQSCSGGMGKPDAGIKTNPIIATEPSCQQITCITEDKEGFLWVGSFRGLNKYDGHSFAQYYCADDTTGIPDNHVYGVFCDSRGRLWVSTIGGACVRDEQDRFEKVRVNGKLVPSYEVREDSKGRIFLKSQAGLCLYDERQKTFRTVITDIEFVPQGDNMFIDRNDNLWLVGYDRVDCFSTSSFKLQHRIRLGKTMKDGDYLSDVLIDDNGLLWLMFADDVLIINTATGKLQGLPSGIRKAGLYSKGAPICATNHGDGRILFYAPHCGLAEFAPRQNRVTMGNMRVKPAGFRPKLMFADSHGNIWMGSENQGITAHYTSQERFCSDIPLRDAIGKDAVMSVAADNDDNLWMLRGDGAIAVCPKGVGKPVGIDLPELDGKMPFEVFADRSGNIWIGADNCLVKARFDGRELHTEKALNLPRALDFEQDRDGNVWVSGLNPNVEMIAADGSRRSFKVADKSTGFISAMTCLRSGKVLAGVYFEGIRVIDPKTGAVTPLAVDSADVRQCMKRPQFVLSSMLADNRDNVWIGTIGNGLLLYNAKTHHLKCVDGILCSDICSIREDQEGFLWVSTMRGLYRYNPQADKVDAFFKEDGIGGNQFYDRASCRMSDGTMVFGGTHGITIFNPLNVYEDRTATLRFGYLRVFNHIVTPGDKNGCLDKRLDLKPTVRLSHWQRTVGISFSTIDFGEFERTHYYYKLDGYDKEWINGGTSHEAFYSNLPSGHYTLRVRAVTDNLDNPIAEDSLEINVKPAPWNTWWAWLIYIVAAAAIVAYVLWNRRWALMSIREANEAKRKLQELLSQSTEITDETGQMMSQQDKLFMDEIYKVMEQELDNADFNADRVSELIHVSRSKLYYKIKDLTGSSPADLFRVYKLNRAAQMLKEGKHNVSEIACLTGFKSLSSFSTAFKKQFGVSPSQWKNKPLPHPIQKEGQENGGKEC